MKETPKTRTLAEIEAAFREMGLDERSWGAKPTPEPLEEQGTSVTFFRIETTSEPLIEPQERGHHADMAQPSE